MAETGRLEAIRASMVFHAGFRNRHSKTAVNAVSLAIGGAKPTITAIVGESGSGKTTLANLLLGFLHPTGGEIRYSGKNLTAMSRSEQMTFRREVQAIFQDPFGTFNPLLPRDSAERIQLDVERAKHWLSNGALPTDRVHRFLDAEGLLKREARNNPEKGKPGKKRIEREEAKRAAEEEKAAAAAAAEQEAADAASAAEEEADEAATDETAAEEAAEAEKAE